MSKVQVDTIDTRSGTSTMQIGSTNTSTINIGVSGDTVNIPSGVTIANAGTATGFGGTNTPYFVARRNSAQTLSNNAYAKVQFNVEVLDSASAFGGSTWIFSARCHVMSLSCVHVGVGIGVVAHVVCAYACILSHMHTGGCMRVG